MLEDKSERGQAIFEFVIFIPFLLIFIATLVTVIGAVNGSINQVKATRNYFYMLANNNSMLPATKLLLELKNTKGLGLIGISSVAWRVKAQGESSLAPCYKIATFVGETPVGEECDARFEESFSTFIKVKTMYGLCATTYDTTGNPRIAHEVSSGSQSCMLNQ